MAPSAESIQKRQVAHNRDSVAVDSLRPVFNTLVRGEPLNAGPQNLASRNYKNALSYGVDVFTYDYFVLSGCKRLTDGRTDRQMSIAKCDLMKLDAHNYTNCLRSARVTAKYRLPCFQTPHCVMATVTRCILTHAQKLQALPGASVSR